MREIGILLAVLLTTNICYASDGGQGQELFSNFKLLIGIGLFGVVGSAIVSLFGNAKVANLITKVSYFAGFIVFLSMATILVDKFIPMYEKIEKFIG